MVANNHTLTSIQHAQQTLTSVSLSALAKSPSLSLALSDAIVVTINGHYLETIDILILIARLPWHLDQEMWVFATCCVPMLEFPDRTCKPLH